MGASEHLRSLLEAAKLGLWRLPAAPETAAPKNLLIIGYAAVGDALFFLPVLESLRDAFPAAKITWLADASPVTKELLPATGLVDKFWLFNWEGPEAAQRDEINQRIVDANFDAALLTLSAPAHYFARGLASIPLRAGHTRPLEPAGRPLLQLRRALVTGELTRRALLNGVAEIGSGYEYAVERNLRLLSAFGLPVPSPAPAPKLPISEKIKGWAENELSKLGGRPRVALHLGPPQSQYYKIWAPERFGALCARLTKEFDARFAVVGAANELGPLERARKNHPLEHHWLGKTNLLESFALISGCDLFIGNDTGLAKAAAALGVPTATIWGLSDPAEVGVPWGAAQNLDIRTGITCSPCARLGMAKESQLNYLICGHHDCLEKLEVPFAFEAIRAKYGAVLDSARRGPYT